MVSIFAFFFLSFSFLLPLLFPLTLHDEDRLSLPSRAVIYADC